MTAERRWRSGDAITVRYVGHSDSRVRDKPGLLQGWPYVVVVDRDDLLALYMPVGTRMRLSDMADRARPLPDLVHGEHPHDEFRRGEVLRLMRPGDPYSVWLHWKPGEPHDFLGWYVNLEAPFVRTPIGVDTTDLSLDVVVTPDGRWSWKDEQFVKVWEDLGVFTPDETRRIYAAGHAAIAEIEARRPPFDDSWLDWRPDSGWSIPQVADDWDLVPGVDIALFAGRRVINLDPAFASAMGRQDR